MKTENIHLGFGTIGCALKFHKDSIKRFDGSLEYHKMLYMLVRNPSISKITILQKSDWVKLNDMEKIEFDPRGVLFDPYSEDLENFSREKVKPKDIKKIQEAPEYKNFNNYIEKQNPPIDVAYFFIGMGYFTNNSIPNFLASVRQGLFENEIKETGVPHLCKIKWDTYNYSSPVVHWLNMSKTPWYMISLDPRYIRNKMRMRDTFFPPKEIISQYEGKIQWDSVENYEDNYRTVGNEVLKDVWMRATGIEKLARINEPIISPETDRPHKMILGIMQSKYGEGEGRDERLEMLKKWVFAYDDDNEIEVYGKWSPEVIKGYEKWFKGMVLHTELDKKLRTSRYTIIQGIRNEWSTAKWADTLAQGVLPFLVPGYDSQYSVVPKDHFIRVKDPSDFHKKMKYLDKNPDKRIVLVKKLQENLLKNATSGKFVYEILNKSFERTNLDYKLSMEIDETVIRKTKSKSLF